MALTFNHILVSQLYEQSTILFLLELKNPKLISIHVEAPNYLAKQSELWSKVFNKWIILSSYFEHSNPFLFYFIFHKPCNLICKLTC